MRFGKHRLSSLAILYCLIATPVSAQVAIDGQKTEQIGNVAVSVGGGTTLLTLPDVPSLMLRGDNGVTNLITHTFKSSEDFGDEWGWNINGSIAVPTGSMSSLALNGFWANITGEGSATCSIPFGNNDRCLLAPLVDDPNVLQTNGNFGMRSEAERDVNNWGASLESRWVHTLDPLAPNPALSRNYFALGADIRGIDQNLTERFTPLPGEPAAGNYSEGLDTRYYGAYAA